MIVAPMNRVHIDLDALRNNFRALRDRLAPGVEIMAMVKADAYGHGLIPCAQALWSAGARAFGVADVAEGMALRRAGVGGRILVLLGVRETELAEVVTGNLTPVIFDLDMARLLAEQARKSGVTISVHLKVDTGMGRLGIMPEEVALFVETLRTMKGLELAGFFSHFPVADGPDSSLTHLQGLEFSRILQQCGRDQSKPSLVHIANSAAMLRYPDTHFDMVRPGISLYGCCPSGRNLFIDPGCLAPVMSFKTQVLQVKDLPAGHGISYGHTAVTRRPTRLAVLPVGYHDGYSRKLSNRGKVLIHGQSAPVLGRVCMNACMVDVTDVAGVRAGDEVVLMGRQGELAISADQVAGWMETISYEVLCLFGGRNRKYYDDTQGGVAAGNSPG